MRSIFSIVRMLATKGLGPTYREILPEISRDSVVWIEEAFGSLDGARVLEVGCGLGSAAGLIRERGGMTVAIDIAPDRVEVSRNAGVPVTLCDAHKLAFADGSFDLVLSINVIEHLREPRRFVDEVRRCLQPDGYMYLAWAPWLSPLGGHDFSPFHYLGPRFGYRVARIMRRRKRFQQVPYETLWPVHVGPTLQMLSRSGFEVVKMTPRYFPALSLICRVPLARELFSVNCQMLIRRS